MKFIHLVSSDIAFVYPTASRIKKTLSAIINPSIRAAVLVRCAQCAPRPFFWIFRNLLITLHGIDVGPNICIGSHLSIPHPVGIVIGSGVKIGESCRIFQNVTLGRTRAGYPTLGNNVTVYPNSVIVGDLRIEDGRRIRACTFLAPEGREPRTSDNADHRP